MPDLAHLLRPDDSSRRERKVPRPLTAENDQLLQRELGRPIWPAMYSYYSATPVCASASASSYLPIACTPALLRNGQFMSRSEK